MPIGPHMNPLISLLRWSIQGMRKEHTRVPLVGLGSQFYPIFRFFPWKVGHTQSCGQLCALVVMRQSSSLCILQCNIYIYIALQPAVYAKYTAGCMPNTAVYAKYTGGAFEIMASHDTLCTPTACTVYKVYHACTYIHTPCTTCI